MTYGQDNVQPQKLFHRRVAESPSGLRRFLGPPQRSNLIQTIQSTGLQSHIGQGEMSSNSAPASACISLLDSGLIVLAQVGGDIASAPNRWEHDSSFDWLWEDLDPDEHGNTWADRFMPGSSSMADGSSKNITDSSSSGHRVFCRVLLGSPVGAPCLFPFEAYGGVMNWGDSDVRLAKLSITGLSAWGNGLPSMVAPPLSSSGMTSPASPKHPKNSTGKISGIANDPAGYMGGKKDPKTHQPTMLAGAVIQITAEAIDTCDHIATAWARITILKDCK